jgi:hypothetical protein
MVYNQLKLFVFYLEIQKMSLYLQRLNKYYGTRY